MPASTESSTNFNAPAPRLKRLAQPCRALIVDDQRFVVNFVDTVLRGAGYLTETTTNPLDALRAGETGDFDLLVTDLHMPEMNGDELARRLLQVAPDLKVLYFTGDRDGVLNGRATLSDNESIVDKPCTMAELLEAVQARAPFALTM